MTSESIKFEGSLENQKSKNCPHTPKNNLNKYLTDSQVRDENFVGILRYTMNTNQITEKFLQPTLCHINENPYSRKCNEISDEDWVKLGITRIIQNQKSGRAVLDDLLLQTSIDIKRSTFFKNLSSKRRMDHLQHTLEGVTDDINKELIKNDPFSKFKCLDDFSIYSGDGHYHEWACHDPLVDKKNKNVCNDSDRYENHHGSKVSIQHYFMDNMRTQTIEHMTLGLSGGGRHREHDIHALKRTESKKLRMRNKKGKKVLLVWDRAGHDQILWHNLKCSQGIYFLTREKVSNKFESSMKLDFDIADEVNIGVCNNEIVQSSKKTTLRRVTFVCPDSNNIYTFLTNLPTTIPPGIIAYLYKCRWDIEKAFDTFKNKYEEKKSWSSSECGKKANAMFLCLTYNLILAMNSKVVDEEKVEYKYDKERKQKRCKETKRKVINEGEEFPTIWEHCIRVSQITVKFIRWLRAKWYNFTSWEEALVNLQVIYDRK